MIRMFNSISRPVLLLSGLLFATTMGALSLPAAADPARWEREGWTTDFSQTSIEFQEILSGGPPKDGIPSIDNPQFVGIDGTGDLQDVEPVMTLNINGDARAYPLRVLMWHEIVNDVVGGQPVAVTYCPLCNAAIVFDSSFGGEAVEFGTTGKLRNSDLVMYDRKTETWWQQFTGEAIVGSLLGTKLPTIPSRLESYDRFKKRHPEGKVLVPNNVNIRDYGRNPYSGYDSLSRPFLYGGEMPDGIEPLARVVVVREAADNPVVVSLQALRDAGTLDREGVTLSWSEGQASALDSSKISDGKDVGNVIVTRDGKDVVYDVTFAFVAHAFMPEVPIEGAVN